MANNLDNLDTAVGAILAKEQMPTAERIRQVIAMHRVIDSYAVTDIEAEKLAKLFEERHSVTMTIGAVLKEADYLPWLEHERANITPYFWERYRKLLAEQHLSGQVITTLDNVTDRTLGLLEKPRKDGPWDRRGMVVGHVQSGKTANYVGLVCKAADAGYKLIIVIAGIHNNLRNQTQVRIDEGFVGRDSARILAKRGDKFVGVGRYDNTRLPVTFTNSLRDFSIAQATNTGVSLENLREPAILVIKKNSSTLKYLLEWLREHNSRNGDHRIDAPMLLIDDEADNASINVRYGKDEVSKINSQIRDTLQLFERSCYVGYTATPFANIFIDPKTDDEMLGADLFPRNFIVSLDPPVNYFGASKVFLSEPNHIIQHIADNNLYLPLNHKIDTSVDDLPQTLKDAVRTFIIAIAMRIARNQTKKHNSMLVNASRFTAVQGQIRNRIHELVSTILASVRVNGALAIDKALLDPEIAALHSVWTKQYLSTEFTWPQVFSHLLTAVAPIKVVEVNSQSSGTLNYGDHESTGLNVIAVGGYSLSRGLTLEGLSCSYFLRNSMMYDTLMQMGRWFGYRPGYEDLCRVWMPQTAEGWYRHISEAIELLRDEFRTMEAANATPDQFGLKVRSDPESLIVTARNKMGSSEPIVVSIGLANRFIETATLKREIGALAANRVALKRLVDTIARDDRPVRDATQVSGGWLVTNVPAAPIASFILSFQNHPASMLTDPGPVHRFIKDRISGELEQWDILFASLSRTDEGTLVDNNFGLPINCQTRTAGGKSDLKTILVTDNQRVASRGVEKVGLTSDEISRAETLYRETHPDIEGAVAILNYPDYIYRRMRKRPLLIVHLLKIVDNGPRAPLTEPVVAWSISFPAAPVALPVPGSPKVTETRVEYIVNAVWLREYYRNELNDTDEDESMADND